MAISTDRFTLDEREVVAVSRSDSHYHERMKEGEGEGEGQLVSNYYMEICLFDGGRIGIDYEEDKAARDEAYDLVAAVIP